MANNNMKKLAAFITLFFLCISTLVYAGAATPQKIAEYQGATLYRQQHLPIIVLRGSFYEMGQQYGHLLKPELIQFTQTFKTALSLNPHLRHAIAFISRRRLPQPQADFFKGMQEATGINPNDLILLDHSIQLIFLASEQNKMLGCSMISTSGSYTLNGQLIIGRNFDWIKQYQAVMAPYLMIAVFHPTTGNAFATLGYLGASHAAITMMNDHHLFLELNSATTAMGPYIRLGRPSTFALLVDAIWQSSTFTELKKAVMSTPPEEGYTITIADTQQATSIELSSAPFTKQFARARDDTTQTQYTNDLPHPGLLMATNTYRASGWKDTLFAPAYPKKESSTQSFARYANLSAWAAEHKGKITPELMRTLLTKPISAGGVGEPMSGTLATNPDYTYYSIIAIPATLTWQVSSLSDPSWVTVDLKPFLQNSTSAEN